MSNAVLLIGSILFNVSAVPVLIATIRGRAGGIPLTTRATVTVGSAAFVIFGLLHVPINPLFVIGYVFTFACWAPSLLAALSRKGDLP